MTPSPIELALIDRWQRDFPLVERPFAVAGRPVGLDERATIEIFHRLREAGVVSRIGAVVKPHTVGASTLAAMQVAPDRLDEVAMRVSREPLVNHNYERTHALNLWFVIAGPDANAVRTTIARIEANTGLTVFDLPMLQAYHLDLGFPLAGERPARRDAPRATRDYVPDRLDRSLLAAIEDGLPIVDRPYREVGARIGLDEDGVLERLERLAGAGIVTRLGCVVRHRALGYTANAMAVWDIADDRVDDVAARFVRHPGVTLCYRRPRRLPDWRFNLFCMVHAKSRGDAYAVIDDLDLTAETGLAAHAVLFSSRCFKQRGAVFSNPAEGLH
jgi:DNA-binding Lrp family transcriptional regulator